MASARLSALELLVWGAAAVAVAALPSILSIFNVVQITVFLIFCLLAVSLDLAWGLAGLLSFGQTAFFGIGGYAYAIISMNGVTTLGSLAAAIVAAGVGAGTLGYIAFYGRLSAMFLAVMTLTVTLILLQVMGSTADPSYHIGVAALGGYNGMTNIPSLALDPPFVSARALGPVGFYWTVGGILIGTVVLGRLLMIAPFGRVLTAIGENEERVELLGYDVRWRKLAIFSLSGAVAGLAGALFSSWGSFINPEVFSLAQSAQVVIWVLVGGRGSLYGAVVGALLVQAMTEYLGSIGTVYTTLALGSLLVVFVLLLRHGLLPAIARGVTAVIASTNGIRWR
jgi:ABC-type branched-subunit amino acid transport system permease subunit